MDIKKILDELRGKYPGKKYVVSDDGEFQEIVCEIEPASVNPERSVAVAIVGKSRPHKHEKITEVYEVIKGELTLYVDGIEHVLKEDERFEIKPGVIHSAQGNETWFYTYSTPGWLKGDHIRI